MSADPNVHPKDRTTGEEWVILNLADTWVDMDDRVRASQGKECVPEAYISLMALQEAVRIWRKARIYDPDDFSESATR